MKLSELIKELQRLNKLAKKAKVDPEVKLIVSPSFPILTTLRDQVVFSKVGSEPTIYLAEGKEEGDLFGEIVEEFNLI